jgi:hypothetical protein
VSFKISIVHGAEGKENTISEKSFGPALTNLKREKDCTKKRRKTWMIRRLNSIEIASSI